MKPSKRTFLTLKLIQEECGCSQTLASKIFKEIKQLSNTKRPTVQHLDKYLFL